MRFLKTGAKWFFALCLPVLMLTASIAWAANSLWLYEYGFEKYGISRTTGLAESELDKAAAGLIHYFKSNDETISITVIKDGQPFELFNEREVAHLKDVKGLFLLDYWILLGTLVYTLTYTGISLFRWKERRQLAHGLISGSCLTLALIAALGLAASLNFNQLFWQFHLISFANDFWLLDPARDYLIMLFPQGFWYDTTLFCAIATAVMAVILCGIGIYLKFAGRHKE